MLETQLLKQPAGDTESARFDINDPFASTRLALLLKERIGIRGWKPGQPVVVVCIGTDRSTGDALGPLVGSRLQELRNPLFKVYGTLDEPVHAANLSEVLERLAAEHPDSLVIAVDACLGCLENVGTVTLGDGSLKPGAGVKKDLPDVGDLHIAGVVNVGGFLEYMVLQNTRLNVVMRMAQFIVAGLRQFAWDQKHGLSSESAPVEAVKTLTRAHRTRKGHFGGAVKLQEA